MRAVLLVDVAALAQPLDRPLHPALAVQRPLARPDVEVDAEVLEAGLDAGSDLLRRPGPDDPVAVARPTAARLPRSRPAARPRASRRTRRGSASSGSSSPSRRAATDAPSTLDLAARVVEVVLARDLVAGRLEHAAQQVAHERAARVADRQRTGRVGGHELDVDLRGVATLDPAEAGVRGARDRPGRPRAAGREPEVDEARARPPRRSRQGRRPRAPRSARDEGLGDRQRRPAQRAGELQREVGWQVAVLGVAAGRATSIAGVGTSGGTGGSAPSGRACARRARRPTGHVTERRRGGLADRSRSLIGSGSADGRISRRRPRPGLGQHDLARRSASRRASQRLRRVVLRERCGSGSARRAPPRAPPGRLVGGQVDARPGRGSSTPQNASHSSVSPRPDERQQVVGTAAVAAVDEPRRRRVGGDRDAERVAVEGVQSPARPRLAGSRSASVPAPAPRRRTSAQEVRLAQERVVARAQLGRARYSATRRLVHAVAHSGAARRDPRCGRGAGG